MAVEWVDRWSATVPAVASTSITSSVILWKKPVRDFGPRFRPEIPVSYQHGKYVFDFASCWSTWVNIGGDVDLNLNIGSGNRNTVAHFTRDEIDQGDAA